VIKPWTHRHSAGKVIAHRLAQALRIDVPQVRYVSKQMDAEVFAQSKNALLDVPSSDKDVKRHVNNIYQHDFVMMMEFVPGFTLQGIFAKKAINSNAPHVLFTTLGHLFALDCLLNNQERAPMPLWKAQDDISGVIIDYHKHRIVGIDQHVNAITDAKGQAKYLRMLRAVVAGLKEGKNASGITNGGFAGRRNLARSIAKQFKHVCFGTEPTPVIVELVLAGMREVFALVAMEWASGALGNTIAEAEAEVSRLFGSEGQEPGPVAAFVKLCAAEVWSVFRAPKSSS